MSNWPFGRRKRPLNTEAALTIRDLEEGDVVKLEEGVGDPPIEKKTTQVICDSHEFSALTNKGVKLMCKDGEGVEPTGKRREDFEVNNKAKEKLAELEDG